MEEEQSPKEKMTITKEDAIGENKKPDKKIIKQNQEEIRFLKDENLLINIIDEIHKEGVVGEESSILILTNKIFLRLVKNVSPTSSNILVSDETGGGKDFIVSSVCKVLVPEEKYLHRTDISEKAFNYWHAEEEDFFWDGYVIHLEDPSSHLLNCQAFKVRASGGNIITVVRDQRTIDLETHGKPVLIVTSFKASIDEEGERRWDVLRIDISEKLTKAVKKKVLESVTCQTEIKADILFRHALQFTLRPNKVVIPFADALEDFLPNKLLMRTQTKKLLDYIKASAILYQYQREKDDQGRLVATWFDYDYARFVFSCLRGVEGKVLNKVQEEFISLLSNEEHPMSIKELSDKFKRRGKDWIYRNLDFFISKGLIEAIHIWDDKSNKDIQKIFATSFHMSGDGLPSSVWFSDGFDLDSKNQQQEGFLVFSVFSNKLKILDDKRVQHGLDPIFQNWYQKSSENQVNQDENTNSTEENGFLKKDKKGEEPGEKLHEKVNKLRRVIEKNRRAGYNITDKFLSNNFDSKFIEQCKSHGLLLKNSKGEYDFNWR